MVNKRYVIAAALIATALTGASEVEAACKQGFCTSGYYVGTQRWVDFTASRGYTHFNVFNGYKQIELGRNQRSFSLFSVRGSNDKSYVYRIQGCVRGGIFSKSNCNPWVTFTHTDKS